MFCVYMYYVFTLRMNCECVVNVCMCGWVSATVSYSTSIRICMRKANVYLQTLTSRKTERTWFRYIRIFYARRSMPHSVCTERILFTIYIHFYPIYTIFIVFYAFGKSYLFFCIRCDCLLLLLLLMVFCGDDGVVGAVVVAVCRRHPFYISYLNTHFFSRCCFFLDSHFFKLCFISFISFFLCWRSLSFQL